VVGRERGDAADREPGRETPAKARSHELVAHAHVRRQRDVGDPQAVAAPVAIGDQAHPAAQYRHRHGMVGIGQQQRGGRARHHPDHLPHQATGVEYRLAHAHAVAAAGSQDKALARGVQVDVQHRRQLHVQAAALDRAEQAAQALVLLRRDLQPRHPRAGHQHLVAQPLVFGDQLRAGAGGVAEPAHRAPWQSGHGPQRLHQHFRLAAQAREPAAAMVEEHQRQRQPQVGQQAQGAEDLAGACSRGSRSGGTGGIGHGLSRRAAAGVGRIPARARSSRSAWGSGAEGVAQGAFLRRLWPMRAPMQTTAGTIAAGNRNRSPAGGLRGGLPMRFRRRPAAIPARRNRCRACPPAPAPGRRHGPRRSAGRRRPARAVRSPR
jgi:hypothetical protein